MMLTRATAKELGVKGYLVKHTQQSRLVKKTFVLVTLPCIANGYNLPKQAASAVYSGGLLNLLRLA